MRPRKECSVGDIVIVHLDDRWLGGSPAINHRFRKFRVESFPFGRLAHCANLRALDDSRQTFTVSRFWLEVLS